MSVTARAVVVGMLVMLAGTLPRNIVFAANLRFWPSVPWAVPVIAMYLWFFWRYLDGKGSPESNAAERRELLRANRISAQAWMWSLIAGGLGIAALVLALGLVNRMLMLPKQDLPDLSAISRITVWSLLLAAAPVAGIVEEAAFRGYMQGLIERRNGLLIAVLITGTMFAITHLDFTPVLWPYYVAVAAIYGGVTYLCNSILPAIVLHTFGNVYSNLDLLLHGRAEWQAAASPAELIWVTGADKSFWVHGAELAVVLGLMAGAFVKLRQLRT